MSFKRKFFNPVESATDLLTEKTPFLKPSMQSYIQWQKNLGIKMETDTNLGEVFRYTVGTMIEAMAIIKSLKAYKTGNSFVVREYNKEKVKNLIAFERNKKTFIAKCLETMDDSIVVRLKKSETWDKIQLKNDTRKFWRLIKDIVFDRYGGDNYLVQTQDRFRDITQGDQESLTRLAQRVEDIAEELATLGEPRSEMQKVYAFIKALHPRRFGEVKSMASGQLEFAKRNGSAEGMNLERILNVVESLGQTKKNNDKDSRGQDFHHGWDDLDRRIIAALSKINEDRKRPSNEHQSNSKRQDIVCWNCNKKGHISRDCKEPKNEKKEDESSSSNSG